MSSEKRIPFLDLKGQYNQIKDEVLKAVEEVFANTAFTNGFSVKNFEKNFADFCDTEFASTVNSGTSALHLALRALDIGKGDEVIIPANTFIATAWAALYVNATPVFVDCDPETWQIDSQKIEEKITEKTKAIIGVHLYGQPFDIDAVKSIADKYNIYLIEDAAQAHGAKYSPCGIEKKQSEPNNISKNIPQGKGKRIGGFGEMACFSFYPGKNLGTYGEGGAITTNNENYFKRIQSLKDHASVNKYYHEEEGYNMRMGGVEGAVLGIKLKYIDDWNNRRREIAKMYQDGITNPKIKMQKQPDNVESIYHLFVVTTEDRQDFIKYLNNKNIFPGMHYPVPCHLQKAFTTLGYKNGDMPNSEYLAEHCVSLPMFAELSDKDIMTVTDVINNY